jgi:hypothetical protein
MQPEFTFAIVTDSHVDVRPERVNSSYWNKRLESESAELLRAAVREINKRNPDFVVHCGDITNASDEQSFREAMDIMSGLKMPFYFVMGNHDTYTPDVRNAVGRLLGSKDGTFYRAERLGDWRLLLLDTVYWRCKDGSVGQEFIEDQWVDICVPEEEMDWLRNEFASDETTPTLCFTHAVMAVRESYPVGRVPENEAVKSFTTKLDKIVTCDDLSAFLRNQRCVKAAFGGHGGWHDCVVQDGLLFCQTAELVEYPHEMRFVRVFDDHLETEVFGFPDSNYAERTFVPENSNAWVYGRPEDRSASYDFR